MSVVTNGPVSSPEGVADGNLASPLRHEPWCAYPQHGRGDGCMSEIVDAEEYPTFDANEMAVYLSTGAAAQEELVAHWCGRDDPRAHHYLRVGLTQARELHAAIGQLLSKRGLV